MLNMAEISPPELESIIGNGLVRIDGQRTIPSSFLPLSKNSFVGLFFGAEWYSPCLKFADTLAEISNDLNQMEKELKVVIIPLDRYERNFRSWVGKYCNGRTNWYSMLLTQTEKISQLKNIFRVQSMPHFVLLDYRLNVVNEDCRESIVSLKAEGFPWIREICEELAESTCVSEFQRSISFTLFMENKESNLISSLGKFSKEFCGQVILDDRKLKCFYADKDNKFGNRIMERLGTGLDLPVLTIFDLTVEKCFRGPSGEDLIERGYDAMVDFLNDYKSGKAMRIVRSETPYLDNQDPNLPRLKRYVGANIRDLLIRNHVEPPFPLIFVHVFSDSVDSSRNFSKELMKFTAKLDEYNISNHLVIVEIDGDKNDLDRDLFPEKHLPIIKLFQVKPNNETKFHPFLRKLTFMGIVEFLHQFSDEWFDLSRYLEDSDSEDETTQEVNNVQVPLVNTGPPSPVIPTRSIRISNLFGRRQQQPDPVHLENSNVLVEANAEPQNDLREAMRQINNSEAEERRNPEVFLSPNGQRIPGLRRPS